MTSALEIKEQDLHAEGGSLLLRIRPATRRVELEMELGAHGYAEIPRTDTHAGIALYLNLGQATPGGIHPFLVGGAGVNLIHPHGKVSEHDPRQVYLEGGAGLAWQLSRHLSLSGDVRAKGRKLDPESGDYVLTYQKRLFA